MLCCLLPFILLITASITDEATLTLYGYSFFPRKINFRAYEYLFQAAGKIARAYGVTILVTLVGTTLNVTMTMFMAYLLSKQDLPGRNFLSFFIFFTMLFSGGMIANYLVMTKVLMLKNTIWALILPLCMNSFNVIVLRTFFKTSIPDSVVESAKIDGASEWKLFFRIVIPMAMPGLATIGLFLTLGYWNDWFNALMYLESVWILTEKIFRILWNGNPWRPGTMW